MRLQFDDVTFDPDTRQLWLGKDEAHLSPKAFDLLALLIAHRPHAVSKADLRARLWPGTFVSDSSLPSLISEIREALGDQHRRPQFLRTLHGYGYAFQFQDDPVPAEAPAAAGPAAWLVGTVAEIALSAGPNVLGREGADVILLKSSTISRRHARVTLDAGGAVVEDLGSKNGTFVNDQRVTGPTPVVDGSQVRIGSLVFTFRLPDPDGSTQTLSTSSAVRSRP